MLAAALVLSGALLSWLPVDAAAQLREEARPRSDAAHPLLRCGARVLVSVLGLERRQATVVAITDSLLELVLPLDTTPRLVRWEEVDLLWLRVGTGKRAGIASAIGAGIMAPIAVLAAVGLCDSPRGCDRNYAAIAVFGAALGAGVGLVSGLFIDELWPKWRRLIP